MDMTRVLLESEAGLPVITATTLERLEAALVSPRRFIVLEGKPGTFCEGIDLETLRRLMEAPDQLSACVMRFGAVLEAIVTSPALVIALVDGAARGGGLALAAACDLVLATPGAVFQFPETLLGLVPGVDLPYICRRVGLPRTRSLAMGGSLTAHAAAQVGLVDDLVSDLEAGLQKHLRHVTRADERAIAEVKRLLTVLGAEDYQGEARATFLRMALSGETQARVDRFLNNQPPWR